MGEILLAVAWWFIYTAAIFIGVVVFGLGLWFTLKAAMWCIIHIGIAVGMK